MTDRYQDRPFPADHGYDRGENAHAPARQEGDPLAELARLIGQTDPYAMGRANQPVQAHAAEPDPYDHPTPIDDDPPAAGPPPWMQRAARHEAPQDDYQESYPSTEHPLRRYATPVVPAEPEYHPAPPFAETGHEADPSRYDEALYGEFETGAQQPHDPAYADDGYGDQDGYAEEPEVRKRSKGLVTVAAVLALAVVGTGAAFAYRTYVGSPRSGEPPIIRADTGPTKIVPAPADGASKVPDRMAAGDGAEKIVPREEAPVDVNARSGPRVVFPPLNQNSNPPPAASVAPGASPPAGTGNGTLASNEPRRIRTLAVKGDQPDAAATPVGVPPSAAKPAPAPRVAATAAPAPALAPPPGSVAATRPPPASAANANASSANAPLSLTPQGGQSAAAPERTRVAATNPVQTAPGGNGGYLVQVASQKNEADAQASYRALQGKYPSVLGSRSPVIKRADLGDKGVYYRAMVGPFGSPDEATQFCGNLKTAGGQCVVQRN
jgi:hypothetical protein